MIIAVSTFSIIFLNSSNSFTCSRRISQWSYEKKIKTRKVSSEEKEMAENTISFNMLKIRIIVNGETIYRKIEEENETSTYEIVLQVRKYRCFSMILIREIMISTKNKERK